MFASTSLFISLNSPEFVGRWIYGTEPDVTEPILNIGNYMLLWAGFQLLMTVFVAFFVPEVDPELAKSLEE